MGRRGSFFPSDQPDKPTHKASHSETTLMAAGVVKCALLTLSQKYDILHLNDADNNNNPAEKLKTRLLHALNTNSALQFIPLNVVFLCLAGHATLQKEPCRRSIFFREPRTERNKHEAEPFLLIPLPLPPSLSPFLSRPAGSHRKTKKRRPRLWDGFSIGLAKKKGGEGGGKRPPAKEGGALFAAIVI